MELLFFTIAGVAVLGLVSYYFLSKEESPVEEPPLEENIEL